ncbi:AAA family ATPase [Nitrosomonas oligotropha]|uniref:AAA family ATPase n=1 Tax=Nitrosomonas oligotropha TaxID=42354 RepID=UPI00136E4422|nr:ATP-binding protein [Nitrosomonas oligotropha]MXS83766.1 ATP-binding protein [Nitrosomonas oligotropha]
MASAEQLKALLKSHIDGDEAHFYSVAMQVAAHEAKVGHGKLAEELRAMIDLAKRNRAKDIVVHKLTPINQPRGELSNLLEVSYPRARLSDMILVQSIEDRLKRIIKEQRHIGKILDHGLCPRRKLLLVGPPGTGKTLTASALAGELGIPLFLVRLDALITKYMGETAAKLRQVFDSVRDVRGIYFFDEFDAIGSQRGIANDVGEIRRVLNSFLQMIEQDESNSIIIAATNHPEILDYALFRRFDDVIEYGLPSLPQIISVLKNRLTNFSHQIKNWDAVASKGEGLSYAEITRAVDDSIKDAIIHDRNTISEKEISSNIEERKAFRSRNLISR